MSNKKMPIGKTLVIGASGLFGRHFLEAYRKYYPDTVGTTRQEFDMSSPNLDVIDTAGYEYALIAAAVTSIARCENEKKESYRTNVTGTLELVKQLKKRKIIPIVFSSDYVFDGIGGDYDEESPLYPLNEYGRQKAVMEKGVQKICGKGFLLVRPSKVFGLTSGDGTLLDEMANNLKQGIPIRAAYDQIFCPLSITDLVHGVMKLQSLECRGIFHICGENRFSRLDIGQAMAKKLSANTALVQSISLDDLNESFERPKNTSMKCNKFHSVTGMTVKPLMSCIDDMF